MFIQVISGKTSDPDAFTRQSERWEQELRPGAKGYLGATSGITVQLKIVKAPTFPTASVARTRKL